MRASFRPGALAAAMLCAAATLRTVDARRTAAEVRAPRVQLEPHHRRPRRAERPAGIATDLNGLAGIQRGYHRSACSVTPIPAGQSLRASICNIKTLKLKTMASFK